MTLQISAFRLCQTLEHHRTSRFLSFPIGKKVSTRLLEGSLRRSRVRAFELSVVQSPETSLYHSTKSKDRKLIQSIPYVGSQSTPQKSERDASELWQQQQKRKSPFPFFNMAVSRRPSEKGSLSRERQRERARREPLVGSQDHAKEKEDTHFAHVSNEAEARCAPSASHSSMSRHLPPAYSTDLPFVLDSYLLASFRWNHLVTIDKCLEEPQDTCAHLRALDRPRLESSSQPKSILSFDAARHLRSVAPFDCLGGGADPFTRAFAGSAAGSAATSAAHPKLRRGNPRASRKQAAG